MNVNSLRKLIGPCLFIALLLIYSTTFANTSGGAIAGGGGDAMELRVDEIRADILSWIKKGGAKGLKLPSEISYDLYVSKLTRILQPKFVVIGFVEKDDDSNEELQVNVNGTPKTCRGFLSKQDLMPHILCNISRFQNASPAEQYKLIHHEYAGLVGLEKNEGAASDYFISSQLTDYLKMETILRLAVKSDFSTTENTRNDSQKLEITYTSLGGNGTQIILQEKSVRKLSTALGFFLGSAIIDCEAEKPFLHVHAYESSKDLGVFNFENSGQCYFVILKLAKAAKGVKIVVDLETRFVVSAN